MPKVSQEERFCYYGVLLGFLYAVGNHQAYLKMGINDEEGVFPVQEMLHNYGMRGRIDEEIRISNNARQFALESLNKWSQKVGFLPMNLEGEQRVMKFFEDEPRRKYVRNRVQKCFRTGELLSIADLMRLRYEVEAKNQRGCKDGETD